MLTMWYLMMGGLFVLAWVDWKYRQLSSGLLLLWLVFAACCQLLFRELLWQEVLLGLLPGAVILVCARISGEAIGQGDGVTLLGLGIFGGFWTAVQLFFLGLLFSALYAAVLLVRKKAGRKTRIAFLPFLWLAGIWRLLL